MKTNSKLMENSNSPYAVLVLLLVNSITLCLGAANLNSTTDKQALVSFKNSITSDVHATLSTNWSDSTSVCNWIGVSCGIKHRRVTVLNLSGFDLSGTIAPHLGNLTFLKYLDVSSNNFMGFLPFELSKLRHLKVMNVGVNSFTGEIPAWLGSLPQLEQLYLYTNNFSGNIPKEIGNSSFLKEVSVHNNQLSGNIPEEIGNISSLELLKLMDNELSGSVPRGIFNVPSMREIRFGNNRLSGWLPIDMCNNMPNIKWLSLSYNQFEGQIPPNIWKCRHLEILSLSFNSFRGEIPSEIGSLSMLRELYLGYNHLRGVPAEIGNLSRLEILNIESASLTGNIPSSVSNMSSLTFLSFSYNSLSEYGMEGKVSTNGDVYSFGIMLLEMLTGKKPTDDMFGGEMSIKEWVSEALKQNAATEIVAAALLSREDQHFSAKEQCVLSVFELAMKCLAVSANERINMIEAAVTLQKIKETFVAAIERHRP